VSARGPVQRLHSGRTHELSQLLLVVQVISLGHLSLGLLSQLRRQQMFPFCLVRPEKGDILKNNHILIKIHKYKIIFQSHILKNPFN
jgi:hypothetical protein